MSTQVVELPPTTTHVIRATMAMMGISEANFSASVVFALAFRKGVAEKVRVVYRAVTDKSKVVYTAQSTVIVYYTLTVH
jgi:hypothetical protein